MKNNKTTYMDLFTSFFRIGLFTFGGGYAMLPMLERECVETTAGLPVTSFWTISPLPNAPPASSP